MGRNPPKSPDRPRRAKIDDARRARLYLAELNWLTGAPEDGRWRRFDSDELFALEGVSISKSRRAARTVLREHPLALKQLVGDVERWWAVTDAKLAWCSALVADPRAPFDPVPLLPNRIGRLVRGGVGRELAIAWLEEPPVVERALTWLAANEAGLAGLDERVVSLLARLAIGKGCEAGVAALIAALAVDAPDPEHAVDRTRNAESALLDQSRAVAKDPGRTRPLVLAWLAKLGRRQPVERQRALALVAQVGIAETFAPWTHWERATEPLLARATELAQHEFDNWHRSRHVTPLITNLIAARNRAPEPVSLRSVLLEIDMLASEPMARFHASIARLLAACGDPQLALPVHGRANLLLHVARAAASTDDDTHPEWLWDAVAVALERGAPREVLGPWLPVMAKTGRYWLEYDMVEHAKRRPDVVRFVDVLAAFDHAPTDDEAEKAAKWLAAGIADPETIVDVIARLHDVKTRLDLDVARAVIALADGTAVDIAALARQLLELVEDQRWHTMRSIVAFVEQAARGGAGWIMRGALAAQRSLLVEAGAVAASLPKGKLVLAGAPRAAWIERYPEALHHALSRLAAVDPDAERVAAKKLATDLPDPADLEREIAALRESGKAPKRLASLEQRLANPTVPSPKRLANLAAKLEAAACEIALDRFVATGSAQVGERFVTTFGLPSWDAWTSAIADVAGKPGSTESARLREILFALLELEPRDRALAGKLLHARCGPPPWDLRDEPANQKFLARMRAAKLDPAPWLDDQPRVVTAKDGKPISLGFAADPLDVFAMGWHFDTCLSPRGGNFFSVVANAADINKRVLYARRDNKIVGRCLFALTDGLALIVFQQYCHDGGIDFTTLVKDFATDLATRIGTQVAPRGPVKTLLARDWYDDGARDLVGRFAGLGDDFDLRTIAPEELVTRLRELLGRALDDVSLPIVVGHSTLKYQPRHLAPLVPFILASDASQLRLDAARLAFDNEDFELADRLLGNHDHAIHLEHHSYYWGSLLAHLRPSITLGRLRRTRDRHVRSWENDSGDRVAIAGIALEKLRRPRQAAAMYRLAIRKEGQWLGDELRGRLKALGEPLDGEVAE